ncbi:antibiotic biosynthesis monooxygenase family protein [Pseudonocardia spinosispora]|uniref:antibiotic biosynthesis monooxygenase family protein n=1 Tax=Pseudonocardia spinosispora TaxID=103441 RepID=UPI0004909F57|nr:antibiotic biosynthesis monooxygenase family protein [Pseudonocardia spinosispora]
MIIEIATLDVQPGRAEEFAQAYRHVQDLLTASAGFRSVRLTRGVENPSRFVAVVEWDSVEAHEENFVKTERFSKFAAHLTPLMSAMPAVEHFADC